LIEYEVKTGDWRNLFAQLDAYNAVTAADIQRVAKETFTPKIALFANFTKYRWEIGKWGSGEMGKF
jgi:predicted Zn-dependent peptidase